MREPRTYLKIFLVFIFGLLLIGYSVYQSRYLIIGPTIELGSPLDGTVTKEKIVEIRGRATNAAFVFLNDRQIFTDEAGNFREILLASEGYNIMTLRVKDGLGRERKLSRVFVYKGERATSSPAVLLHS